jgi:hypothetical protein
MLAQAIWIASLALAMTRGHFSLPLPAQRGEVKRYCAGKQARSRDTLPRPSFARHHDAISKNRFAPGNKREAKRRKAHANHVRAAPADVAICRCLKARLRAAIEGAPAFRRFTAALATGYHPDGSAPEPGFLKARRIGVLPARRTTL